MYIISGVYKIQSKVHPERFYIGSAISIRNRWLQHLADLRKNKHHSSKLQNHFNKYGEEDLVFIILELCFPEFAVVREQYYIDTLKPFFNCRPIANSNLGIKLSEEAKRKISKARLGKPCSTKGIKRKKMTPEFCKNQSDRMKGNSRNKGKHWKWTEEQKDKWLRGDKNPAYGKNYRKTA